MNVDAAARPSAYTRTELSFRSRGERCAAWHYVPLGVRSKTCIVMAHGFGLTRDCGLEHYAERFALAQYQVLVFDYRHFGSSGGRFRQVISPRAQVDDWLAAAAFARTRTGVKHVVLWGTSFSGGHVVSAAARDTSIAAVSAQCPMMDGFASVAMIARHSGIGILLRMTAHGIFDLLHACLGRAPHALPIVAPPGQLAAMATEDSEAGYRALVTPTWRNEVAARLSLTIPFYRPVGVAHRLRCPLLVQACADDSVASPAAAREVVRRAGTKATLVTYPIGHFDIYSGAHRERAIRDQLSFFDSNVGGSR
jgi:uncharacterized protein